MSKSTSSRRCKYPVLKETQTRRMELVRDVLSELQRKKSITGWKINYAHTKKQRLYCIKGEPEDTIRAEREDCIVTVYRSGKETLGEATVPILSTRKPEIRLQLQEAAEWTRHIRKPSFDLPEPSTVEFPQTHDPQAWDALWSEKDGIGPIWEVAKSIPSSQFEAVTSAAGIRIVNSKGIDISYPATMVSVNSTFVAGSQESSCEARATSLEQLGLATVLAENAEIAASANAAGKCEPYGGDVLLTGKAVRDFLAGEDSPSPLLIHAHARYKMLGISRLAVDEPIGEFVGETFSIASNPILPLGTGSAPVDADGIPLRTVPIIRNGIFMQYLAGPREAAQMQLPLTGGFANLEICPGATREEHLRGLDYVEIKSFSWFTPDPYSGDFSAEIRLGYRWKRGKKVPFRGGHLVGNVFDSLLRSRLSREIIQSGAYYGPRAMLLKNAMITA